jgi:endonuclease/exonuclease/phosphatase family metal-dependent hydrolase
MRCETKMDALGRLILRQCLQALAITVIGTLPPCAKAEERLEDGPASLRALTFNIRYDNPADGENGWKHRRDGIAKLIAERKVDVAGLQEVLANQLDDLRERLPGYDFLGVGRDDGKRKGEFSPLLVRKEAFEVVSSGTFWLSPTPNKPGSKGWDAALPRICTWVQLRSRQPGRGEILAASTHFDHRGEQARLESAEVVREQLTSLQTSKKISGGMVLMGDFNCTEKDAPYAALLSKNATAEPTTAWIDVYHADKIVREGPNSTWNGFKEIMPGQRIDFILCSGFRAQRHEVIDARIGERFLSDHLPVLVTLN